MKVKQIEWRPTESYRREGWHWYEGYIDNIRVADLFYNPESKKWFDTYKFPEMYEKEPEDGYKNLKDAKEIAQKLFEKFIQFSIE